MRLRNLTSLIDDVRKAADIEYATGRFPDSEITEYINQSIARLYTLLDRLDNTYYLASYSFSTANGTGSYALPSDFWALKGVNVTLSAGQSIRARRYMPEEGVNLENNAAWNNYGYPIFYRLQGPFIVFKPAPTGAFTVTLDYTPSPPRLKDGNDDFDGVAGFERWVILDAAIKCKAKDSLDASALQSERMDIEAWLNSIASSRDVGAPEFIQDVQSIDVGRYFSDPW